MIRWGRVSPVNGGCPECGNCDRVLNIGPEHWAVCHAHRTKWSLGSNLFSGWRDESEETWKRNAARIEGYREVEPMLDIDAYAKDPGPNPAEVRQCRRIVTGQD